MMPNPSHNLCALYPPSIDQTAPLSEEKRKKKKWSSRPTETQGHLQLP